MSARGKSARGRGNPKRSLDNSKSEDVLDEEEEDDVVPAKKSNKGGGDVVKGKGRARKEEEPVEEDENDDEDVDDDDEDELGEEEEEEEEEDEEGSDPGDSDDSNPDQPAREFGPRSFVVLKTDFDRQGDPPLWRIDGNSLLQKYTPFKDSDGTMLYKSTSVYSGWSINNKDSYHAVTVAFKRQEKNDSVVQFDRSQIKLDKKDK